MLHTLPVQLFRRLCHPFSVRTRRLDNLDILLTRGCDWLLPYLATHPTARERLKVCNTKSKV
ncbi:MAG: hypothetical protein KME29_13855 [Calothrix sp. FI2-JRJ7]|nr:hypothetical protein [Calothrix sp. FI2-JRJ7]